MFKMSHRLVLKSMDSPLFHTSNQPDSLRVHLPQLLDLKGVRPSLCWNFRSTQARQNNKELWKYLFFSDICKDTTVGEREMPLLRRVYFDKQNIIYQNPYEVQIILGQFQDVHVYIKDAKNASASFLSGEVTVTLLLRRIPFL